MRASEPLCPFCGAALPLSLSASASAPVRLGRAATFAFGAALAVTGCASSTTPPADGGSDAASVTDGAAGDGGSNDDAGTPTDAGTDAGFDAGNIAPPYGTPPFDAGVDAGGGIVPAYGTPPLPPRD